jgi:hypothetical protein
MAKVETTTIDTVLKDEGDVITTVDTSLEAKFTTKRVKREPEHIEHQLLETKEKAVKSVKRRRKV